MYREAIEKCSLILDRTLRLQSNSCHWHTPALGHATGHSNEKEEPKKALREYPETLPQCILSLEMAVPIVDGHFNKVCSFSDCWSGRPKLLERLLSECLQITGKMWLLGWALPDWLGAGLGPAQMAHMITALLFVNGKP